MSRTLCSINNHIQSQLQSSQQQFYLQNQIPLFLNTNQNTIQSFITQDTNKCKSLIESLCDNQIKTKSIIDQIKILIQSQTKLDKGIGFFNAKNMIFTEYIMLLKLYELFKINGKTFEQGNGLELYKRLAYLKTLLLKLAPVEKKLEYQKNKILKHAEKVTIVKENKLDNDSEQQNEEQNENEIKQQSEEETQTKNKVKMQKKIKLEKDEQIEAQQQNQMNFKPRPSTLMNIKKQKQLKIQQNDKYQAPKISSNLSKQDKIKQRFEKQKQRKKLALIRRLQSDLVQDDRAEERYLGDEINQKLRKKFHEKTTYQEQGMIRLPDSKKEKFFRKQMIRNETRKNQLEEEFKQVQMVRKLFDEENDMERKILASKGKHGEEQHHNKRQDRFNKGNNNKTHKIQKNNKGFSKARK